MLPSSKDVAIPPTTESASLQVISRLTITLLIVPAEHTTRPPIVAWRPVEVIEPVTLTLSRTEEVPL